jgi:hypothetical protein
MENIMTTKNAKNASKNGKVTTTKEGVNVDAANLELAKKLQGTLNIAGEFAVYLEIDSLNEKCFLSVAGIRATLEEVEKVGSAPSLRSDYAQQFPLVRQMRKFKGADTKTLKELFNLAVQGRKTFGTDEFAKKVSAPKATLAGLSKAIKTEKDKKKAEEVTRGAGKQTESEKKAGKLSPAKVAESLADYLEKGGKLPEDILERLIDAINLALEEGEEEEAA